MVIIAGLGMMETTLQHLPKTYLMRVADDMISASRGWASEETANAIKN